MLGTIQREWQKRAGVCVSDRVMQTVPNTLSETVEALNDTVTSCLAKHCISCQVAADASALCLASRSPPDERTVSDEPCASLSGRRRTTVARPLCHVAGEYVQQSQNVALSGSGGVPFSRLSTLCVSRAVAAAFVVLGIPTYAFAAAMW